LRRIGGLFDGVVSYSNLYRAYRKALLGARRNEEQARFYYSLENELVTLRRELVDGTYNPGPYRYFMIFDPKEREIAIAPFRDRVVHHAIVNVLEPIYERRFVYDSYATRKKKGSLAAIKRAQSFLRESRYYMKLDISKYFASIDRNTLLEILKRKLKDARLLELITTIVWNPPDEDRGLPIGNMTSQFFANVYLDPFDHYVKETLKQRHYIRYMDDFVVFTSDRSVIRDLLDRMRAYLKDRLALNMKENGVVINTPAHGLGFLGVRIFPSTVRLHRKNLTRCLRKIRLRERECSRGQIDEERLVLSVSSIVAHMAQFNTLALRRKVMGSRPMVPTG
jgi:retron-type reverse transcriptase